MTKTKRWTHHEQWKTDHKHDPAGHDAAHHLARPQSKRSYQDTRSQFVIDASHASAMLVEHKSSGGGSSHHLRHVVPEVGVSW